MTAYYNEIEPYCCQWLRNLIAAGHLPTGDVDERPIQEVSADDLEGYDACHFFAGLGGWPYALRLAGWEGPVWTGSCPCQPLSSAGQRRGHADERHLWPAFHALIAERRPATVFGEQVASKDGREWLSGVRADLEHVGYVVGAADLPAAGVKAKHSRSRLWWVANNGGAGLSQRRNANTHRTDAQAVISRERSSCFPATVVSASEWTNQPLLGCGVHGIPGRVDQVRAYGNAIVPQVGAAFVAAYMDCRP